MPHRVGDRQENGLPLESFSPQEPKQRRVPRLKVACPTNKGGVSLEVSRGDQEDAEYKEKQDSWCVIATAPRNLFSYAQPEGSGRSYGCVMGKRE